MVIFASSISGFETSESLEWHARAGEKTEFSILSRKFNDTRLLKHHSLRAIQRGDVKRISRRSRGKETEGEARGTNSSGNVVTTIKRVEDGEAQR